MRYIGGKSAILEYIDEEVNPAMASSVIDVFAGSGVVSRYFARKGMKVISNDILYFSYVLTRGMICYPEAPKFENLGIKNPISFLNGIPTSDINDDGKNFVWDNYSPHGLDGRMYFQERNALKIDLIRRTILDWKKSGLLDEVEYYYLLSCLIAAVPYVSNIAGVYGAFLKHWDPRSFKELELAVPAVESNLSPYNFVCNSDYKEVLTYVSADVLYADPPYNNRQYLPNYHVLETIARYDYPKLHGVSGMRDYGSESKSDFCVASKVEEAFESLIKLADVDKIVISYNNEGLLDTKTLSQLCQEYARADSFKLVEIPYKKYKSHKSGGKDVVEQLFVFKKK